MKRTIVFIFLILILSSFQALSITIDPSITKEFSKGIEEINVIVMLKEPNDQLSSSTAQIQLEREKILEERKEIVKELQENIFAELNIETKEELEKKIEQKIKVRSATSNISNDKFTTNKNSSETKESDVKINDETTNKDITLEHQFSVLNGFTANITKEGLKDLISTGLVESISEVKPIKLVLSGSVPLINANDVWNLSSNGLNITGVNQAVCVVDTGVDYTHPALGGCTNDTFINGECNKVIAGWDYGNNDNDPVDVNSHGTHVAGIIASNDTTYRGVAPGAKIVALKVFTNAGSGSTANAIAGIDWCISNSTRFNISVITLSLAVTDGGGNEVFYSSNCDGADSSGLARALSRGASFGIFVDASSGNTGNSSGITSPACGENVTSVGSVTKSDAISGYNAASILDLLAPGSSITSTVLSSTFGTKSGTSMAAPHVAGAAAVLIQYWKTAFNITLTPREVEKKLKISGVQINDTRNSIIFPRIDLLAAIQPFINFTTSNPLNNTFINYNSSLINITSDVNLSTALLEWIYSNGTNINLTMTKANGTNYYLNTTKLIAGTHYYRIYANDSQNTMGTSTQRTITIDYIPPLITITNPINGTNLSFGTQAFNTTITELQIDSVKFSFNNATGISFNITPNNTSGNWNTNLNLLQLTEGYHTLTILANDSAGNYNRTTFIDFTIDRTPPAITIISPQGTSHYGLLSNNQTFNISARDLLLTVQSVLLSFTNTSGNGFNITAVNQSGNWIASYNVSLLPDGTYAIWIIANDTVNNINRTQNISFIVDNNPPSVSFNNPPNGQNYTFLSGNLSFNITVRDIVDVQSVYFVFDNSSGFDFNITASNQSGYWIISYNVSSLTDGTNTVKAYANDSVGNKNFSEFITFNLDTTTPIVILNTPVNNGNQTSIISFNCSGLDNINLANLTLYGNWSSNWHANQTVSISGTNTSAIFTKTLNDGNYLWNCQAGDTASNFGFASTNYTLFIDSIAPITSAISSGTPTSTAATISWTTNENSNSSINYGTSLSLGSISNSGGFVTSHSISLSSLSSSTTYYYNVSSCDNTGNCQVNGSFTFTTSASGSGSSSSSSSSGGGGGGGGGGGSSAPIVTPTITSTTTQSITEKTPENPVPSSTSTGGTKTMEEKKEEAPKTAGPITFTQKAKVLKDQPNFVKVDNPFIWIKELEINLKKDKEVNIDVIAYSEKPKEVPPLENVYQYLQITTDFNENEVSDGKITFKVPIDWVKEHGYFDRIVGLYIYEKGRWKELSTSVLSKNDKEVIYQAKIDHLSYFAIGASQTINKGSWLSKLAPTNLGTKSYVLVGLVVFILILILIYFLVREKEVV